MNYKTLIYSFLVLSIMFSCTSAEEKTEEKTETEVKSPIEIAWDEVMVVHDEVMPKMSELSRLKKQLRQDSMKHADLIATITKAEDGMWDWMHQLTPLKTIKTMPEAEAKATLDQEMSSITEVKRLMLESIETANMELQKTMTNEN
ncbi:MAG: hypothetical protein Sapg2KO_19960 [Saprospiraceae bacterium]